MGCIETGEVITDDVFRTLSAAERRRFVPIPDELADDAERKLKGRPRAFVAKAASGKLAAWFSDQRESRRRNR